LGAYCHRKNQIAGLAGWGVKLTRSVGASFLREAISSYSYPSRPYSSNRRSFIVALLVEHPLAHWPSKNCLAPAFGRDCAFASVMREARPARTAAGCASVVRARCRHAGRLSIGL